MSYDPHYNGAVMLVTKDPDGRWISATDLNFGEMTDFNADPDRSSYSLGSSGYDPETHTAWAVINHGGSFAVAPKPAMAPVP
jgi:hypothetical protein